MTFSWRVVVVETTLGISSLLLFPVQFMRIVRLVLLFSGAQASLASVTSRRTPS
jgi:hypothetical protein